MFKSWNMALIFILLVTASLYSATKNNKKHLNTINEYVYVENGMRHHLVMSKRINKNGVVVPAVIDMGLSPQEAMEAIGREKAMEVRPQEFGVPTQDPGMGALSGVPTGDAMMPTPMQRPNPNALERMRMEGRDRSFNPNDMLRPDNTPNT